MVYDFVPKPEVDYSPRPAPFHLRSFQEKPEEIEKIRVGDSVTVVAYPVGQDPYFSGCIFWLKVLSLEKYRYGGVHKVRKYRGEVYYNGPMFSPILLRGQIINFRSENIERWQKERKENPLGSEERREFLNRFKHQLQEKSFVDESRWRFRRDPKYRDVIRRCYNPEEFERLYGDILKRI